jgi:hydrogenase expression/formation protein HypE
MSGRAKTIAEVSCPLPIAPGDRIVLGHGSGGKLSADLIRDIFLPAFDNPVLAQLDDQAVVEINGCRLAFTTDSFVVRPLVFPGGDVGSLAVHGTVNDLAMGGARPLSMSAAFIMEEGLSFDLLRTVAQSVRRAADQAGVQVVTGDTKVVEKGSCDELFINTSGIGVVPADVRLSANQARPGDKILLSGSIGEHGIAILACREGLQFETTLQSDSAPLYGLVAEMLKATNQIRCMRDPTRGGISSALNEIAQQSRVSIELEERRIPIRDEVRGACEMLGFDPLYVANEGKLIAIVAPEDAEELLQTMRGHPLGRESQIIGTVSDRGSATVKMRTYLGTTRIVDMLAGDQLPRIC